MAYVGEILPLVIVAFVLCFAYLKKISVFSVFVTGAKKGISTCLSVLPTLVGIVTAITMLSASGALESFVNITKPFFEIFSFPTELLPLAILRPISGSGANSAVINIFEEFSPDSSIGKIASVLSASTETTFYAVSVYMGNRNYKSLSYTIPVSLFGDFLAVVLSVVIIGS
ncbi:MAG: spore maturation protein [Clostridia bacterium]